MALDYHNFDLQVGPDEQIYATSKTEGEAGPVRLQLDSNQLDLALQLIEQERGTPDLVRDVGRQLYEALFPPPIQIHFDRSRDAAPGNRLRIRLRIGSARLAALPWEFICAGDTFLGLGADTPIVRYPEVPLPIESLEVKGALRVLVVIASPANYPNLDREAQAADLKVAFSGLQTQGALEVEFLPNGAYVGLMRRLRSGEFHVLHYLGYSAFDTEAQRAVLLFEEENGMARKVSGDELGHLLYQEDLGRVTKGARALRLVLINDCESSTGLVRSFSIGVATSLARSGIPAALAMHYRLPPPVSRTFAVGFYEAIARGLPIDAAAAQGRASIAAETSAGDDPRAPDQAVPGEWGAPVLFMHADDSELFHPRQVQELAFAQTAEQVYAEIEQFKVETRDRPTRFFLDHLPAFILLSVAGMLLYWFVSQQFDALFISGTIVAFSCVWLLRALFREQVPDTFDKLWRRRLIIARDAGNLAEQYLDFLRSYNALLNDQRYTWLTRAVGLAVALYSSVTFDFGSIPPEVRLPLRLAAYALSLALGYILGTLLWKMIATVIATRRLSYRFDLDIRPTHPDRCGGLKPLGDLYFAHAWIVLLAGLFFAAWVLALSLSNGLLEQFVAMNNPAQAALIAGYPALCGQQPASGGAAPQVCGCLRRVAPVVARAPRYLVLECVVANTDAARTAPLVGLARYLMRYYRWLESYQVLLVIIALVAIFTFVFPMYNTHRIMRNKGPRFRRKADSLAGESAELERYLDEYGSIDDEESNEINQRLEWLEDRYQKYCDPPLWPFDIRVRSQLAGSLGIIGVSLLVSTVVQRLVGAVF